jgi:hypothetical protein
MAAAPYAAAIGYFRRFDFQALRADFNGAAAAASEKFGLIRRPEGA